MPVAIDCVARLVATGDAFNQWARHHGQFAIVIAPCCAPQWF